MASRGPKFGEIRTKAKRSSAPGCVANQDAAVPPLDVPIRMTCLPRRRPMAKASHASFSQSLTLASAKASPPRP